MGVTLCPLFRGKPSIPAQPICSCSRAGASGSSMSSTGNCYDNAPAESFFDTLKNEWVDHHYYITRLAKISIFDYIEVFYNRQRRHSSLDYVSPVDFELAYALKSSLSCCP